MAHLTLPLRLETLNDYIDQCRRHPMIGAKQKKEDEQAVTLFIRKQLRGVRFENPVTLRYTFYERDRRRDKDNVASYARKVIQDALARAGVINGDGWKGVAGTVERFEVDKKLPRIEVEIIEAKEGKE